MKPRRVCAVYFSPTGTTRTVVEALARRLQGALGGELAVHDFTLPAMRESAPEFGSRDLVVFGTPVYAGRVPNLMLPYIRTLAGAGALAVPVVVYGNRHFDDALVELRDLLAAGGFRPVAAGAFVAEHAFSHGIAGGRPDAADMALAEDFAGRIARKLAEGSLDDVVEVEGVPKPYRGYYQPKGPKGEPVDIRKVKPLTKEDCTACGVCAAVCPMGAIPAEDPRSCPGVCVKCCACVRRCPAGAKYFADPGYLHHVRDLEGMLARRAEPVVFL